MAPPVPVSLLMPFAFALVANTSLSTTNTGPSSPGPHLVMLYGNRRITDGETVPVIAPSHDETRIEALITCAASDVLPNHVLVFQFYAQNAMLLEPRNFTSPHTLTASNDARTDGLILGYRRVILETGGFLKLQCNLNAHSNDSEVRPSTVTSVTANFTFAYAGDPALKNSTPHLLNSSPTPQPAPSTTPNPWRPIYRVYHPSQQQPSKASSGTVTMATFVILCIVLTTTTWGQGWC